MDVVEHLVADDERAREIFVAPREQDVEVGGVRELIGGGVGHHRVHVRGAHDGLVNGQGAQGRGREDLRAGDVGREEVIDVEREVFPRVVRRRHGHARAAEVGGGDAVADERAVRLRGDARGENAVAREVAGHGAVIHHRHGRPAGALEGGIRGEVLIRIREELRDGERERGWDVRAGRIDLIFELHAAHALRVGDARGDGDWLPRLRCFGQMRDGIHRGRRERGEDGVLRAGRAEGVRRTAQFRIHGEVENVVGRHVVLRGARLRRLRKTLDANDVCALLEQRAGIEQHHVAPRIVGLFVVGGVVESGIGRRGGLEAEARDFHAVDPDDGRVVVHHAQEHGARHGAGDGESFAEENRAVADGVVCARVGVAAHVGRHVRELRGEGHAGLGERGHGGVAVLFEKAERRDPGEPRGILGEGRRAPRGDRRRGFAHAFAVAPAAAARGHVGHRRLRGGARAPVAAEAIVERWVQQFERGAVAVRRRGPRGGVAVGEFVHGCAGGIAQFDVIAIAAQAAGPRAERGHAVESQHRGGIAGDDGVAAGGDARARRKRVVEPLREPPVRHVHRRGGRVVELDEFRPLRVARGVVIHLVDFHMQGRRMHRRGDDLLEKIARAVGHAHAHGNGRVQVAGEIVLRDELVAGDGKIRVVRRARAGHERVGEGVVWVRVRRAQASGERAREVVREVRAFAQRNVRRRHRRGQDGDGDDGEVRVGGAVVRLVGKAVRPAEAGVRREGAARARARDDAVRGRIDDRENERGRGRVRIVRNERAWRRGLVAHGEREVFRHRLARQHHDGDGGRLRRAAGRRGERIGRGRRGADTDVAGGARDCADALVDGARRARVQHVGNAQRRAAINRGAGKRGE